MIITYQTKECGIFSFYSKNQLSEVNLHLEKRGMLNELCK